MLVKTYILIYECTDTATYAFARIHACTYVVDHIGSGKCVEGIFRIPGQVSLVNQIFPHLAEVHTYVYVSSLCIYIHSDMVV